jgi:site-specific DNA-cytosine methylase
MKILDLFSGTGSIPKQVKPEDECVSVDISGDLHQPTILVNIMEWDYKSAFPAGHFDVIFAGVPCTEYSRLRDICKNTKPPDIEKANKVVLKTLEIIDYFKPKFWYIENPDGGKLKEQEFMRDLPYHRVSYCMYGYDYRKTTRIWTNNTAFQPKICHKGSCGKTVDGKHIGSIGQKSYVPLAQKYSYPPELVRELLESTRYQNKYQATQSC